MKKHDNIHGKSATTMMRMMVNKMATHDNNYYNKEENNGTNNGTKMATKKPKRHANSSMRTKHNSRNANP